MLPSPIDPPMRQTWAIRGASSGCSRSSSAMFVSGPIGAMTHRLRVLAQDARDQVDGARGMAAIAADGGSVVVPIPASP